MFPNRYFSFDDKLNKCFTESFYAWTASKTIAQQKCLHTKQNGALSSKYKQKFVYERQIDQWLSFRAVLPAVLPFNTLK